MIETEQTTSAKGNSLLRTAQGGSRWRFLCTPVFLLLVAAVLRCGMAISLPNHMTWSDGLRYERIAKNLLDGNGYAMAKDAPLHPFFLTLAYGVSGDSVLVARLMLAVLGTATCYVCYVLASSLGGRVAGRLALAATTFYPLYIYLSPLVEYPQTLCSLLLGLSCLFATRMVTGADTCHRAICFGAIMGLAGLTIPTVLPFALAFACWYLLRATRPWRQRLLRVGLMGATCSAAVLAWSAWHYRSTGQWFLISGLGGINFYQGNCELAARFQEPQFEDLIDPQDTQLASDPAYMAHLDLKEAVQAAPTLAAKDSLYYAAGWRWVSDHPRQALVWLVKKCVNYWNPLPQTVVAEQRSTLRTIVGAGTFVPFVVLAALALGWRAFRPAGVGPVVIFILCQWAVYTVFFPSVRYRSPIDQFLIIISALFVARVWGQWRERATADPLGSATRDPTVALSSQPDGRR